MTDTEQPAATGATAGWTVLRVRGVPVRLGPSVLLLVGLFTWWLGTAYIERGLMTSPAVAWTSAVVTVVLFLGSVLAHEIGHAVTSVDRGVRVRGISLFLLGGVTESVGEPRTARDEIVIVGVGPLISLLLAALYGLCVRVLPGGSAPEVMAGYLAWLNFAMALFNLVPGYPLDGGRLLRAVLWLATSSRYRATRLAARVGQVFALALILGAVASVLGVPTIGLPVLRVVVGLFAAMGLWGGLIGIFLLRASLQAHRDARMREQLGSRRVRDLMGSVPPTVPADINLDDLVIRLQQRPSIIWPVGRPLLGGIRLADLDAVPRHAWDRTPARDLADHGVFIDQNTPMDEALDRLSLAPDRMLIVVNDGEPVGLLTPGLVGDLGS